MVGGFSGAPSFMLPSVLLPSQAHRRFTARPTRVLVLVLLLLLHVLRHACTLLTHDPYPRRCRACCIACRDCTSSRLTSSPHTRYRASGRQTARGAESRHGCRRVPSLAQETLRTRCTADMWVWISSSTGGESRGRGLCVRSEAHRARAGCALSCVHDTSHDHVLSMHTRSLICGVCFVFTFLKGARCTFDQRNYCTEARESTESGVDLYSTDLTLGGQTFILFTLVIVTALVGVSLDSSFRRVDTSARFPPSSREYVCTR